VVETQPPQQVEVEVVVEEEVAVVALKPQRLPSYRVTLRS